MIESASGIYSSQRTDRLYRNYVCGDGGVQSIDQYARENADYYEHPLRVVDGQRCYDAMAAAYFDPIYTSRRLCDMRKLGACSGIRYHVVVGLILDLV